MGIFGKPPAEPRRRQYRPPRSGGVARWLSGFLGAANDRLLPNRNVDITSINQTLENDLRNLRARARHLADNNPYAFMYMEMVKDNVIGSRGVRMKPQVRGGGAESRLAPLRDAWERWGEIGTTTADGGQSWIDVQHSVAEGVSRDGEFLAQIVRGPAADNEFGFALHPIDVDRLDERWREPRTAGGNRTRLGIEHNQYGRPVAYWILKEHPRDNLYGGGNAELERVPASDIIHVYRRLRPGQLRGVPWTAVVIRQLLMLGQYQESELTAARIAAAKMGFFTSPDGTAPIGDADEDEKEFTDEVAPGSFDVIPEGYTLQTFDPQHPTTSYEAFEMAILRSIASGLGVSYATLANDLRNANFSSLRHGVAGERDRWRAVQTWMTGGFHQVVFDEWLKVALTAGAVPGFTDVDYDRLRRPLWQPRGWQAIDPEKEARANQANVALGVKSLTEIAAEHGRDLEDVARQLAEDFELLESEGLDRPGIMPNNQGDTGQEDSNGPGRDEEDERG